MKKYLASRSPEVLPSEIERFGDPPARPLEPGGAAAWREERYQATGGSWPRSSGDQVAYRGEVGAI